MKNSVTLRKRYGYLFLLIGVVFSAIWWLWFTPDNSNADTRPRHLLPKPSFAGHDKVDFSDLRPDLLISLGYSQKHLESRIDAVKSLPSDLTVPELDAILRFLMEYRPATVSEGDYAYFFHELCNKLQQFPEIRSNFAAVLYQVAGDVKYDVITRDYAIQHLRRVWDKSFDIQALQQSIQASFWQLADGEPSTSAAAMLSLHNLGVTTSPRADYARAPVPSSEFKPYIQAVLLQPPSAATISQRMTAVRIAGDRRITSSTDLLITIVENDAEHMLVRTSAINALGKLGMKDQLASLSARLTADPRLTAAFLHATH